MADEAYSAPLLEHFRNPQHAGSFARDAPGLVSGEASEEGGARIVRIQLLLEADGRIRDARFKAFGCPATIASASFAVSRLPGRLLGEAECLEAAEIVEALDVPEARRGAVELAITALRAALARARSAP